MQTESSHAIQTITVLGAGTMGRGIAHVAALAGYRTHLFDISIEILHRARQSIGKNLRKGVDLGKIAEEAASAAESSLQYSNDLSEATRPADLVIEAVPEDIGLKIGLLQEVATTVGEDTLIASNTSGLSITEMAAATGRAEQFAGMHFFNPVHLMRLIELVRGLETSPETMKTLTEVALNMKKEVVVEASNKIYDELISSGFEVLFDDRTNVQAGFKFKDADLLGMPVQVIVGDKKLKESASGGKVEIKLRRTGERFDVELSELVEKINGILA